MNSGYTTIPRPFLKRVQKGEIIDMLSAQLGEECTPVVHGSLPQVGIDLDDISPLRLWMGIIRVHNRNGRRNVSRNTPD